MHKNIACLREQEREWDELLCILALLVRNWSAACISRLPIDEREDLWCSDWWQQSKSINKWICAGPGWWWQWSLDLQAHLQSQMSHLVYPHHQAPLTYKVYSGVRCQAQWKDKKFLGALQSWRHNETTRNLKNKAKIKSMPFYIGYVVLHTSCTISCLILTKVKILIW